jgi:3-hydroxybutyryl-CoA dehydrogenase
MKVQEIDTVCFVGAGTMGCFNALMAAVAGYRAVLYDVSAEALDNVPQGLNDIAGLLVDQGFFSSEAIPVALALITVNPDLRAATADAGLVSESVAERLEVKRDVHRRLDEVCDSATLITTNTSSLLVSRIEDVLVHGDRFAALHSHLGSVLIDIVGGPRTSAHTIDVLERYVESLNGLPLVLKKENPGYVLNAMLGPLLTMAKVLVIKGLATPHDVDRAWMIQQQAPVGPFGLMDMFGLNVISDSWQDPRPDAAHLQAEVLDFIAPYIEKNALGIKTGSGFYSYPQPRYQQADFLDARKDFSAVYPALNCVLIANAILIAHKGVAEPAEIDRAWMVSFSLPRGPFGALGAMGVEPFLETVSSLVEQGLFSADMAEQLTAYLHSPGYQREIT